MIFIVFMLVLVKKKALFEYSNLLQNNKAIIILPLLLLRRPKCIITIYCTLHRLRYSEFYRDQGEHALIIYET